MLLNYALALMEIQMKENNIIKIIGLLDKIWSAGVSFYKQCNMLDLA